MDSVVQNNPKKKKKLWLHGLLWWSLLFELASGASFYGDGFVQLKATESSDHNTLRIRFRTSSTNGLLFLAAGQTDYFLLELHAGRLQLKLDLGSGEQVLHSERGTQLNDLAWHSVEIRHVQHNVTLTVDKNSHTSVKMPGSQQDLNILDGLYVGGSGGLDKLYLPRNLIGFRGCMDEVVFNEHDILSSLRPYTGFKNIYEVSLGCSPQFFATEDDSISFFSSRAYISLPTWNAQHEAVFECVVHTSAKEGIIMYNSAREGDFVAVEIQEGLPVAIIGKGGTKTELRSLMFINDRKWHSIKLHFSSKNLELTVDGEMVKSSISSRSKGFQLKGYLFVGEGGRASLEAKHIKVLLDFKKLGIRQSQIMFRIQEQPIHGQIRLDVDPDQEENTFSMLDLWHGRAMYIHGGSEEPDDFFMFSIYSSSRKEVPDYLKGNKLYRYNITVTPTNDAPELSLPEGNLFVLLENSKKRLTTDVLKATDIDSSYTDLVFSVLGNLNADAGYLELENNPGKAVTSFSYLDLEELRVYYVHTGVRNSRIVLRVSDGEKVSNTVVLRVMAVALEYKIANNTGLAIIQGEAAIIGTKQLSVHTNAVKQIVDIRYDIIEPPQYGELQRLHSTEGVNLSEDDLYFRVLTIPKKGKLLLDTTVLVRDGQKLLTIEDLRYHDADSDFDDGQLMYTRRGIPMGDLVLVNDTTHRLINFQQKDLEEKRVLFIHKGVSTGRFVLFVSDGKHFISSLLDISAHDPFLKVGNNTGLLVQKGHSVIFSTNNFSVVSNLDIRDDQEVIFQLDEAPKYGGLYRNEIKVDSFSQFDLKSGLISYRHDDSKHLADCFNLTVKAKDLRLAASINVKVFLESHQRPPIVQHHNILLVEEGKPVKIDETKLEVTHEDNLPSDIVFTVKVAPFHGFLRRFVKERYVGTKQSPVKTFTQEDINSGNIQYVQVESGKVNDTFILDATNGVTDVNDIRMSVDIIPRLIPLQVSNITLNEGASKSLTQDMLKVTNRHFSGINFLYSLTELPQHGHIEHSRHPGVPITSFTRRQVEHEFIYYVHDSSETLDDNFTVVVNDTGLRKQSAAQTVYIQVTAVNDEPPVITANRVLRVWVSSVTEIRPEDLRVHDMDSPPEELHFMVTPPSNGHLALKSAPMKAVLNFTQAHIDQGQLLFVHKGAMSGGFNFQVNDGVNFTPRQIFSITARALVLSLEKNRPLMVFPGSSTPITNEDLQVVTNDVTNTTNRIITFNVIRHPKLGRLVMRQPDNSTVDISTFTQDMVDRKEVLFVQTPIESVGWEAMDSITFSVTSPPTSLDGQTFKIDISYENTGPEHNTVLLANTGAEVTEGESVVIDESKLDATNLMSKLPTPQRSLHEVWFQVTSLPQHGVIVVGERNLTKEKPNFSQFIINKYGITYKHDNSETTHDSFVFSAWINPKGKTAQQPQDDSDVVEERFNITITPVNDQPPLLKTKSPSLRVVQGDTVALRPDNLKVEDLDNPPDDIKFSVISKPNNGYLALEGSLNESIAAFSQAQINKGSVYFVHDGSSASGVFYFSVTDGHHKPIYKLFNLEVTEITITLVNYTGLTLQQGQTSVSLTQDNLAAESNGKNITIHYQVTKPPNFGKLLKDNQEVTQFEQEDLQSGRLCYHMISLSSAEDSFEFTAFTSEANLTGQVFNITVRPLIQVGKGLRIPNGIVVKLNTSFLNAFELANISNSDPVFEIISHPKYGKVVRAKPKMSRKSVAESFTFQEVMQEKVALELNANMTGVQELNDSLVFLLKTDNTQPAKAEFHFTIVPYDPALVPTTKRPDPTTSSAPQTPVQTSRNGTASPVLSTAFFSTQQPSKSQHKFKGRNRWGNSNRTSIFSTTLGKPTHVTDDFPFRNTPVRVESYPQKTSNPLLVILPLLALLLLVIIFVVLVVFLRHHRQRKQSTAASKEPASTGQSHQGETHRSTTVPTVTVTPINHACPGSPVFDRLMTLNQGSAYNTIDSNMLISSWSNGSPASSSQIIQTTTPTLQKNQYWV
ncbi:Chondroitin sulfate proteoglycan 4 [Collichthys lucidus]|uniref:Chondroitin sulfate proteoglycan 4 n=1 Tax=Collichthys lucidus TaxID=240159 RepID=A0A4U5UTT0_COLLU|nr:Chondroitin sulfate proteoglycan 4 [Collichthys lucidus]